MNRLKKGMERAIKNTKNKTTHGIKHRQEQKMQLKLNKNIFHAKTILLHFTLMASIQKEFVYKCFAVASQIRRIMQRTV